MAGEVIVREIKGPMTMTTTRIHMFTRACNFEDTLLSNNSGYWNIISFTLRSNEEHILVEKPMDGGPPLRIGQPVYKIRMIRPNMEMTVGPRTPMTLLFGLGCLHVEQVPWSGKLSNEPGESDIPSCSPPKRGRCSDPTLYIV
jgi:hypothetical protein